MMLVVHVGELQAFMIEREIEKRMRAHPVLSQMMAAQRHRSCGGGKYSKGVRSSLANDLQLVRFSGGAVVLLLGPAVQVRPPQPQLLS
jgi:hypothetical protein